MCIHRGGRNQPPAQIFDIEREPLKITLPECSVGLSFQGIIPMRPDHQVTDYPHTLNYHCTAGVSVSLFLVLSGPASQNLRPAHVQYIEFPQRCLNLSLLVALCNSRKRMLN